MQSFKVQDKIDILSQKKTRQEMQRLVFEWVKIGHISFKEYLDLFDWICNNSSIVERYEGDNE
jgi:hypothetical protein